VFNKINQLNYLVSQSILWSLPKFPGISRSGYY
jgi:hypothetical protein